MRPSYRTAGWAAIVSGAIGILAIGFLITFLVSREVTPEFGMLMVRIHDAGVIVQFLLLIPVVAGLHKLSQKHSPVMSVTTLATGIATIFFVMLFLLLVFHEILSDTLYMLPQGAFGIWLIVINWRLHGLLPRILRWLGIMVGFGLTIVGAFELAYAIFVDSIILDIPAAPIEDYPAKYTPVNIFLHKALLVGTAMGVLTLPVWTILTGSRLLRERSLEV